MDLFSPADKLCRRPFWKETMSGRMWLGAFLQAGGDEKVTTPGSAKREGSHKQPEEGQQRDEDGSEDGKKGQAKQAGKAERGERVDSQREGVAPPTDIEREAFSHVAAGDEDGQKHPPKPITPQKDATDHTYASSNLAKSRHAIGLEDGGCDEAQIHDGEGSGTDRAKGQPTGGGHIRGRQLVNGHAEHEDHQNAHGERDGAGPQDVAGHESDELGVWINEVRNEERSAGCGNLGGDHREQPYGSHLLDGVALASKHHEGDNDSAHEGHRGVDPPEGVCDINSRLPPVWNAEDQESVDNGG